MPYEIRVQPVHVREQEILQRIDSSNGRTETFHDYQNRAHELPQIFVPLGLPIYRMANYRTRVAQQAHIRREGKSTDFFKLGQENEASQQAQHDLLVKFAEQGRAGSVIPIVNVLKIEHQRNPILITRAGVVVNGNRRLAGMRSIFSGENSAQFQDFSHVKCLVLPAAVTEEEIRDIEIRLQMKQRTELDYDWINECLAIKELRDDGKSVRDLMALMNKKRGEIVEAINALTEADLYLSEWLARPGDYDAIEDAENLFFDIGDSLKSKSGTALEVSRRIAWTLVDRRASLGRRVYEFNKMFGKKADEVASRLAERIGVENEQDANSDDENDVVIDLDDNAQPTPNPLLVELDKPERREEIGNELIDICETVIEIDRGHRDGRIPLDTAQKVNGLLAGLDLTRASSESLSAIRNQLDSIQGHVERLQEALNRAISAPETPLH